MKSPALNLNSYNATQVLTDHIDRRIEDLRESLEAPFIDPRLADYYRGRIAELDRQIAELEGAKVALMRLADDCARGRHIAGGFVT